MNPVVLPKFHGCPRPYCGNAARHDALAHETGAADKTRQKKPDALLDWAVW